MDRIKRIWGRLKRLIKEIEAVDKISDSKLLSAIIAFGSFALIGLIALYCWLFG